MTIQDDILTLEQKQKDLKISKGRYVQAIATPEIIPTIGDKSTFIKLKKPEDEIEEIGFKPKEKDYQFSINVWQKKTGVTITDGFQIVAKRDLGDGIIETVTKEIGE